MLLPSMRSLSRLLKKSIDSGKFARSVLLDFTKVFDIINHATLFSKLEGYGITGAQFTSLKNYPQNRGCSVCVAGASSEAKLPVCPRDPFWVLCNLLFTLILLSK